jgi:hypothetical protein
MQSDIDFELTYENLKARFARVGDSRYFPKNILMRIWNCPCFWMKRELIRFIVWIPVVMIVALVEMLAALQKLMTMPRETLLKHCKEIGKFSLFLTPFIVVSVSLTPFAHKFLIGLFPGITSFGSFSAILGLVTVSVFLIFGIIHDYIVVPKRRKRLEKTN